MEGKGVTANECMAFGGSDTNITEFIVVLVSQLCESTKNQRTVKIYQHDYFWVKRLQVPFVFIFFPLSFSPEMLPPGLNTGEILQRGYYSRGCPRGPSTSFTTLRA